MDKYFDAQYDPRLDVQVDDVHLPDGLISDEAFGGWTRMLANLEERKERKREDKAQRAEDKLARRAARERGEKVPSKRRREADKELASSLNTTISQPGTSTMMELEYTKRGGTREWDQGK